MSKTEQDAWAGSYKKQTRHTAGHTRDPSADGLPKPLLVAATLTASLTMQILLLAPFALMVVAASIFYRMGFVLTLAGLALLGYGWLRSTSLPSSCRLQERHRAPALHAWVDALAARLQAPRIDHIALDDDLNAGAVEMHRGLTPRPTRRVLVLGVPLLQALDTAALEAVVAHELGHFSRKHGRLGHWLYRTRVDWVQQLVDIDSHDTSPWDRAGSALARHFVPWFTRHSFAHSRRCEFEADALAAQAVGSPAIARALQQLALADWQQTMLDRKARVALLREHAEPPSDWLRRRHAQMQTLMPDAAAQARILDAAGAGTHPSLAARLRALQTPPTQFVDFAKHDGECAGAALFGAGWGRIVADHDGRWAAAQRHPWRMQHAALAVLDPRLEWLQTGSVLGAERMRIAWALGQVDDARKTALAVHDGDPSSVAARVCLARCALSASDAVRAVALLEPCIERSPAWAAPVRRLLDDCAEAGALSVPQRERNAQLLEKALWRRSRAAEAMWTDARAARFDRAPLDPTQHAALSAALAAHESIDSSWCVGLQTVLDDRRAYRSLMVIFRVDARRLRELGIDEDEVGLHICRVLQPLMDDDVIHLTWPSFMTEGLPPDVVAKLETLADARLSGTDSGRRRAV